jgi:hypothetical protein
MKRLALLLVVCLAACSGDATPTRAPEPTATRTLAPTPTDSCPGAPRTQLILNERGRVLNEDPRPLNVRVRPGTSSSIVGRIEPSEIFLVLEGPECVETYNWYRVRYNSLEGWIAEGDLTSYFVEPFVSG